MPESHLKSKLNLLHEIPAFAGMTEKRNYREKKALATNKQLLYLYNLLFISPSPSLLKFVGLIQGTSQKKQRRSIVKIIECRL